MVSDGTEFAVGDIETLFEKARRNTKAKHEKWEKYYIRRRRDVQIKVNDWVSIATHPLSSAKKVVAKFNPKFECPYRVLEGINDHLNLGRVDQKGRFGKVQQVKGIRELIHQMILMFYQYVERNAEHKIKSRPVMEMKSQQGGPVRSRKGRGRNHSPYFEERTRSGNRIARRRGD
ncbi:uncharacterized protein TNCV_3366691 [Trichonephila clavipes]|nr:uncharacterized protein TNCV_3366691 [Trichonephila clavipes]